jgi:hypothetical protein
MSDQAFVEAHEGADAPWLCLPSNSRVQRAEMERQSISMVHSNNSVIILGQPLQRQRRTGRGVRRSQFGKNVATAADQCSAGRADRTAAKRSASVVVVCVKEHSACLRPRPQTRQEFAGKPIIVGVTGLRAALGHCYRRAHESCWSTLPVTVPSTAAGSC